MNKERPDKIFFKERILNNRWITSDMIHPNHHDAWSKEIAIHVRRDPTSQRVIGLDGNPEIIAYNFGGLAGVQNVAPELMPDSNNMFDRVFSHRYYAHIIQYLQERSVYTTAAPYDFRRILDPEVRRIYWRNLQILIERTVYKVEKPVILVAHSQGAILVKWFLEEVDPQWAQTYIHSGILINCPFAGTPTAVRAVLKGASYLPYLERIYHKHVEINSGILMGLPNQNAYHDRDLFWKSKNTEVRLEDLYTRTNAARLSPGFEVWHDLFQPHISKIIAPAPVPIHVYASMGIPTEQIYLDDQPVMTHGDGVVPDRSLLAYPHAVSIIRVPRVNHSNILQSRQLAEYIYSVSITSVMSSMSPFFD